MNDDNQTTEWQPIETAPKAEADQDDIWIWAARRGTKLPMLTTWDAEEGHWYTFNLALETGMRRREPGWKWEPTHWMPLQEVPKMSNSETTNSGALAFEVGDRLINNLPITPEDWIEVLRVTKVKQDEALDHLTETIRDNVPARARWHFEKALTDLYQARRSADMILEAWRVRNNVR